MIWGNPGALAGLALVIVPILVHLLARRHAARVRFPAMRFVPPVRAAAVRLRAPSDLALLCLRMAIVVAAVLAAAAPTLVTAARQRAWDARVAVAVVVDTSPSVDPGVAARLADQAAATAFASRRFPSPDVREAIQRATDWLETTAVASRQLVIVGDLQRGSIDQTDLLGVPPSTGIRLIRTGPPKPASHDAASDGWRGGRWRIAVALDATTTQTTWTRNGVPTGTLTVHADPAEQPAAERAAAAARSFGVAESDEARSLDVSFAGAPAASDGPPRAAWIVAAAIALRTSPLLQGTDATLQVGERAGVMTVKTPLRAVSPLAPAIVRAALIAANPVVADPEAETASVDEGTAGRMSRPQTPGRSGVPGDAADGRWLWGLALALLTVEEYVRRRGAIRREVPHADAA